MSNQAGPKPNSEGLKLLDLCRSYQRETTRGKPSKIPILLKALATGLSGAALVSQGTWTARWEPRSVRREGLGRSAWRPRTLGRLCGFHKDAQTKGLRSFLRALGQVTWACLRSRALVLTAWTANPEESRCLSVRPERTRNPLS